jgi:Na+-transporting NADH:ubiquinone oxidoreductase subunit C
MQTNAYTVGFATAVCVVCSLLLSGVSGALKDRQEENRVLDRQKNILVAVGYDAVDIKKMGREAIAKTYGDNVEELVVDASGRVLDGVKPAALPARVASGEETDPKGLALYRRRDPANPSSTLAFAYPVAGKGLWSTMLGYLAVKPNGDEIVGLTFYKHGETPGLGAEVDQPWFQKNFVGKKLYQGGALVGVNVEKGAAADKPSYKENAAHMVDGISGATLTGNGVAKMMKVVPRRYEAFFKANAAGQGG